MSATDDKRAETVYVLHLRATRNDAAVRGLRWLLKAAWRRFGLRAISVTTEAAAERKERAA